MTIIKKAFLFGVALPILLAFINYRFSSITFLEWGHNRINEISIFAFVLAVISCLLITLINYRSEASKKFWYILPAILAIVFSFYIYTILSLSSFGF